MTIAKLLSFFIVAILIGIVVDQKIMLYIHDPAVLEENALGLVAVSYVAGCVGSKSDKPKKDKPAYTECLSEAEKYKIDISEIFHDKIWERPSRKRSGHGK